MKQGIQSATGEILLAVGGAAFFFVAAFYLYSGVIVEPAQSESLPPPDMSDFELGNYYFNQDDDPYGPYDLEKAREYYQKVIAVAPDNNNLVWYQLGRIDFLQGKFTEALDKFDTQIAYFGDEIPNVYYMIGLTHGYKARQEGSAEDWQKGEEAFSKFITYVPASPWPRVDLAWIYFAQGKYEDMKPVLEMGLAYYPENPWLLNMYGLSLFNTGKNTEAAEQFYAAREETKKLSTQDWGNAYPGNHPDMWEHGLREFITTIEKNIALVEENSAQ